MGHGTVAVRNATAEKKSSSSKLEPNPKARQARLAAEKTAAEKATKEAAERKNTQSAKPAKKATPTKATVKTTKPAKIDKQQKKQSGQFLDLGCGFRIAHKPGSAYSTFYRVVGKHGNFEEAVKALEAGKYNLHDPIEANKLLEKMLVPVEKLEEFCRNDQNWKDHADKKTASLTEKAKEGDSQAKEILKNESRCNEGSWSGNIPEMISTCVGYYNHLMELDAKADKKKKGKKKPVKAEPKPNKNVKKFKEAGLVFRRFPLSKGSDKSYVLMFPEKFVNDIKTAILVGRGINEDE